MTKWGERPHWQMAGVLLGSDAAGDWVGFPAGTRMARPGLELVSPNDQVGLVPDHDLPAGERGWLGTFHGPGGALRTYVDITTPPVWDGAVVRTVTPTSIAIPPGTFRVEQRAETFPPTVGSPPPATTSRARVYIDWVKQYTYTPTSGTAPTSSG